MLLVFLEEEVKGKYVMSHSDLMIQSKKAIFMKHFKMPPRQFIVFVE